MGGILQSRGGPQSPQREEYQLHSEIVKSEGPRMLACFPLLCFSAIILSERDPLPLPAVVLCGGCPARAKSGGCLQPLRGAL